MASSTIRAYIPTTVRAAADLWAGGTASQAGCPAFTVTAADRAAQTGKPDEEALEYAAFARAAEAAAEGTNADEHMLVLSADVDGHDVAGGVLATDVPTRAVVSFHVGDDLLWYDVTEAADILR